MESEDDMMKSVVISFVVGRSVKIQCLLGEGGEVKGGECICVVLVAATFSLLECCH